MTNEEARKILQSDRTEAINVAVSALSLIDQYKWERDIALKQLFELGVNFGEKTENYVCLKKEDYEELLEYKNMYDELLK